MRRKLAAVCTAIAIAALALAFTVTPVSASHTCVYMYENANLSGDVWAECGSNIGDANFTNNTNGLHNGCESQATWPLTQSTWNDCVSSARITGLHSGYKIVWYINTNYGFENRCASADGNSSFNFDNVQNDRSSSYRILTGSC